MPTYMPYITMDKSSQITVQRNMLKNMYLWINASLFHLSIRVSQTLMTKTKYVPLKNTAIFDLHMELRSLRNSVVRY
jgi:hypothetical protein